MPPNPLDLPAVTLLYQVLSVTPQFVDINCISQQPPVYKMMVVVDKFNFTGEGMIFLIYVLCLYIGGINIPTM